MEIVARCRNCKYWAVEDGHWPCIDCTRGDGEEDHFSPAIANKCENCTHELALAEEMPCVDCMYGNGNNNNFEAKTAIEHRCMKCGAIIPEGRHICLTCEGGNEMQSFGGLQTPETPKVEAVNHPAHYQGKYECIDEMIALFGVEWVKGFCACNVYKYRYRADRKNGAEDIAKAEWYMQKLMELEATTNEQTQ